MTYKCVLVIYVETITFVPIMYKQFTYFCVFLNVMTALI